MPIRPPDPDGTRYTIVYQDLINAVTSFITSTCHNVGSFSSSVKDTLINGKSFTVWSQSLGTTYINPGHGHINSVKRSAHTKTITGVVSDGLGVVVPLDTVRNQLSSFLADRGLLSTNKKGIEIVSMKSMMNFYANIASFLAARFVYVSNISTSSISTPTLLFYNSGNISYDTVSFASDVNFTSGNITNCLNDLLKSINKTSNAHNIMTRLSFTSCSSSSSSSSSSMFIAYMEI